MSLRLNHSFITVTFSTKVASAPLNLLQYPKFYYDGMLLLCNMFYQAQGFYCYDFFSLKQIFIIKKMFYNTHQVRCYHFFVVEIIVESVNLIQMLKQMLEYFITMMESHQVLIKKATSQNTEQKKGCSCNLYIARNEEF